MKKRQNVILLIFLFLCKIGISQSIEFGPTIGTTFSSFAKDKNSFSNSILGVTGGGFIKGEVNDFLDVSASLLYSQQGAAFVNQDFISVESLIAAQPFPWVASVRTHKIDVPVLAHLKVPELANSNFYPSINLGAAAGYMIKAYANKYNLSALQNFNYVTVQKRVEMTDAFEKFDYAAVIGFGLNYKETRTYSLDINYRIGLSDINNSLARYINNSFSQNTLYITLKANL